MSTDNKKKSSFFISCFPSHHNSVSRRTLPNTLAPRNLYCLISYPYHLR